MDAWPPPGEGVGKRFDLMPIRKGIEVSFGYKLIIYLCDYINAFISD
jgi:hypothetical protein